MFASCSRSRRSIQAAAQVFPSAVAVRAGASLGHSVRPLSTEFSLAGGPKLLPPSVDHAMKICRFSLDAASWPDSRQATLGLPLPSTAIAGGQLSQGVAVRVSVLPDFLPSLPNFA